MFSALDPVTSDDAQDRHRTPSAPSSPAALQPHRLVPHPSEVPLVVRPGLRLDRESDATRSDCDRVDVPTPPPAQRVPHSPPLYLERPEDPPNLFRARPDSAPAGERKPAPGVQA